MNLKDKLWAELGRFVLSHPLDENNLHYVEAQVGHLLDLFSVEDRKIAKSRKY